MRFKIISKKTELIKHTLTYEYICTYIDTWYCININMMNQDQARSSSKIVFTITTTPPQLGNRWSLIGRKSTAIGQQQQQIILHRRNELDHHSSMYILFLPTIHHCFCYCTCYVCMHFIAILPLRIQKTRKIIELLQSCLALVVALHQVNFSPDTQPI